MSLSTTDLDHVRRLVTDRSAIQLDSGKDYLIDSRLQSLARTEGFVDSSALVVALRADRTGRIANRVVEAMTTNETSFFRDRSPFELLRNVLLPQTIAARTATRRIRIWCAAASTGQEPYSIAMTIRDHFPELAGWNVRILGTDLSPEVLAQAVRGEYSQLEVNRGLPAPQLVKHFEQKGTHWRVRDELRRMVEFRELNLIGAWAGVERPDIVFIRNVLIYFDVVTRDRIFARLADLIAPGGYVLLGAGESIPATQTAFRRQESPGTIYYERVGSSRANGGTSCVHTTNSSTASTRSPATSAATSSPLRPSPGPQRSTFPAR